MGHVGCRRNPCHGEGVGLRIGVHIQPIHTHGVGQENFDLVSLREQTLRQVPCRL